MSRCIYLSNNILKNFYIAVNLKAELLPFQTYYANKGEMLPWVKMLLYRYLPNACGLFLIYILPKLSGGTVLCP